MWVSTFHSACVRILRAHGDRLGYKGSFTIYDDADSRRLVEIVARELDIDTKKFSPRSILGQISQAKSRQQGPEEYRAAAVTIFDRRIADVFDLYQQRMVAANAMDFDDLLLNTVRLFRLHPDVLEHYRTRFTHILIDEYQDTNAVQNALAVLLAGGPPQHRGGRGQRPVRLPVPRGGHLQHPRLRAGLPRRHRHHPRPELPLHPDHPRRGQLGDHQQRLPQAEERFGPRAGRASRSSATGPRTSTTRPSGWPTRSSACGSEQGLRWGDVAIFYRTNAQSAALEEAMVHAEVPYKVVGGTRFYDRREVKDVMAYLRVLVNPDDEVSWRRIVNVPKRGVGETSVAKLSGWAGPGACPSARRWPTPRRPASAGRRGKSLVGPVRAARGLAAPDVVPRLVDENGEAIAPLDPSASSARRRCRRTGRRPVRRDASTGRPGWTR